MAASRHRPVPPQQAQVPARAHLRPTEIARLVMSGLFLVLGLVIVAQGLRPGTPWAYNLLGVLMAALGAYRLRLAWVLWHRPEPQPQARRRGRPHQR